MHIWTNMFALFCNLIHKKLELKTSKPRKHPTFKFTTSSGFARKGQENLQDFFASSQTLTVKFAPLTKSKRKKYQFEQTSTTQLTNGIRLPAAAVHQLGPAVVITSPNF